MNERQRLLASYLLQANGYSSQKQIMSDLPVYTNERDIRRDIRDLNNGEFSYIIVSGNSGYAIATKEQAEAYIERKCKTAKRMLALAAKAQYKLQNNGQIKTNNANNFIEVRTVCEG